MSTLIHIQKTLGNESIETVRQLRYAVLREPLHLSYVSTSFSGDDLPSTLHFLACNEHDTAIGCVTLLLENSNYPYSQPDALAFREFAQLRGMAVLQSHQGTGVGAKLLQAVYNVATELNRNLWCNARCSASDFYRRHGWLIDSDVFEIAGIGPHVIMQWLLLNAKQ